MSDDTAGIARLIAEKGLLHLDEPVRLRSGVMSSDFIDVKEALADGADLEFVCRAFIATAEAAGVEFDTVGGMTMGADQFAYGIAILAAKRWFVVRKESKGRGTDKRIEGAALGPDRRVLLVDDVVSMGGSIREAYELVRATGATVAAAMSVVDRADAAEPFFRAERVPFRALVTYRDLGIEPLRDGLVTA